MSVLVIYDAYSTHTNAVYDHLTMFSDYSDIVHHYLHCGQVSLPDLSEYQAIVVHYSARLVTGVINERVIAHLAAWTGKKILFVQDEYDLTEILRCAIERVGFDLVYTCVPEFCKDRIYPPNRFPKTRFVSTITGFAPEPFPFANLPPLASRPIWVGYRGRALPYWYGDLGQEKRQIAQQITNACRAAGIQHDIAWTEDKRIYGPAWPAFLKSCRVTLGTESGCNIFDSDGSIRADFERYISANPEADYDTARAAVLAANKEEPLMNQVSPRIFEAIAAGTGLVLYEGTYSGVIQPDRHFIALRKDGRNISDVLHQLHDTRALVEMVSYAFDAVIASGKFSARNFITSSYNHALRQLGITPENAMIVANSPITSAPQRFMHVQIPPALGALWRRLPLAVRRQIRPPIQWALNNLRQINRP